MSDPLQLESDSSAIPIRPISWLILFGYLVLAALTFLLIFFFDFARDLFESTALIININAVWFSLGIVIYGVYALIKNYRRARLSNLQIKLDTQFLIVMAFLLFGLKQLIDLLVFLEINPSTTFNLAMNNTGKVLEFGGFVAGLASIYFGRKRSE